MKQQCWHKFLSCNCSNKCHQSWQTCVFELLPLLKKLQTRISFVRQFFCLKFHPCFTETVPQLDKTFTVLYILCKSLPCSLPNFTWYMTSHAVWHPIGMCPFKTCSCLDVSNGILNSQVSTVFKFVILIPLWFVINSGNFVKQSKPLHVFWHSFRQKMSQCEWLNS